MCGSTAEAISVPFAPIESKSCEAVLDIHSYQPPAEGLISRRSKSTRAAFQMSALPLHPVCQHTCSGERAYSGESLPNPQTAALSVAVRGPWAQMKASKVARVEVP